MPAGRASGRVGGRAKGRRATPGVTPSRPYSRCTAGGPTAPRCRPWCRRRSHCGEPTIASTRPGHGVSPGSQATITDMRGLSAVLQRFPSIHTIVAHSLSSSPQSRRSQRRCGAPGPDVLLMAPACSLSRVSTAGPRNEPARRRSSRRSIEQLGRRDSQFRFHIGTSGLSACRRPSACESCMIPPTTWCRYSTEFQDRSPDVSADVQEAAAGSLAITG